MTGSTERLLLPSLTAAFGALADAGITWAVLRGGEESVADGGDVDVLVGGGELPRTADALRRAGFAPVPSAGSEPHAFFLCWDEGPSGPVWVRLDVVDRLTAGPHVLPASVSAQALSRRVRIGDRWVLNPDDEFWLLLLHHAARAPRPARPPRASGWTELTDAARCAGPVAGVVTASAGYTERDLEALLERARADPAAAAAQLRRRLRSAGGRRAPAGHALSRPRRGPARALAAVRSVSHPTGLSVAILGPDGAGKTTLAEHLRQAVPVPNRYVYLGVWREYPWDRWLRHVLGARLLLRLLRLAVRTGQVRWHRSRGRLVLLDRFTYDALLPSDHLDRRGRITTALVRRLGAEPDVLLVLDAPAEVMFARKGEQTVEELDRRRRTYLEVSRRHPQAVVLDAAQPASRVLVDAQRALWSALGRRWDRAPRAA